MSDSIFTILKCLGLEEVTDEGTLRVIYGSTKLSEAKEKLQKWLLLLPDEITAQIDAALRQERPFLPPDVTPEMMAVKNSKVPSMSQMEVLYRCVSFAYEAKEFNMAASLAYVVDRATYWSGASKALLQVVDLIKHAAPQVAIAPQIQVRKARVLKDEGDLHGAMKVLNDILERRQDNLGEWKYVDEDQYLTTKAEIIKIKGHILYNMGLLKEAVEPFIESIRLFTSLQNKDDKGIASCLGLLTKCLGKLSLEEFGEVKQTFPEYFKKDHPCLESYVQGMEAVGHIQSLQESLYSSRHLLDADTSLLKYAILSSSLSETYRLLQTILKEMKRSIGAHKTIDAVSSSEQFFEFVRALFMISLTLAFSPVQQDRNVSEYIQQLSLELYLHLCNYNKIQRVARLGHSVHSVKLINISLTVLGLPNLLGEAGEEGVDLQNQGEDPILKRKDLSQDPGFSDSGGEAVREIAKNHTDGSNGEETNVSFRGDRKCDSSKTNNKSIDEMASSVEKSRDAALNQGSSQVESSKEQSFSASKQLQRMQEQLYKTVDTSELEGRQKYDLRKDKSSRGWTYNFGHQTRQEDSVDERIRQGCRTFPLVNYGKPLDPKKQWQTYKHKCVGLPVDPNFFAFPVPSDEKLRESEYDAYISSAEDECEGSLPLVNLSVPYIRQTLENKTKTKEEIPQKKFNSVVNRQATTVCSTASVDLSDKLPLHPHDLPNQPMKRQRDRDRSEVDEDVDVSILSPLVDLDKTTVTGLLEVGLGDGAFTNDPEEYLNSWRPPSEGFTEGGRIQRAFVLNFNPTTEVWTAQSTLAFLGKALNLSDDEKGNCRDAFHVQFLHQDEPRGRYVGKRYRDRRHHDPKRYMQDVVCQMMAGYYVTKFNEAMQNYKRDIQVQFLPAAHLQLLTSSGDLEDCINVEPYLLGDFLKLSNNDVFVDKRHQELATALTHFSFCESKATLMIVDIQGWLPRESSGVIYLTDPQFHTSGLEKFSPYDHQETGMKKFWEAVHPHWNDMCRAMGLERSQK